MTKSNIVYLNDYRKCVLKEEPIDTSIWADRHKPNKAKAHIADNEFGVPTIYIRIIPNEVSDP